MKKMLFPLLLIVCLLSVFCLHAAAADYDLLMGDADENGVLSTADARLILRAAVSLETLDDDKSRLADVDFNAAITTADARMVLRAAVGLETISDFYHSHTMTSSTVQGSCVDPTVTSDTCTKCGLVNVTGFTPAPGHDWNAYVRIGNSHYRDCKTCFTMESAVCVLTETVNRPATCTQDGLIVRACVCGLSEQETTKGGHNFSAWSKNASGVFTSTCANCADTKTGTTDQILTWFNNNVNRLKSEENYSQNITALRYTNNTNVTSDYSTSIKIVLGLEELLKEALDSSSLNYYAPAENRSITHNNLPAMTKDYVSNLTAADIKSLDVALGQTVDVLADFPTVYDVTKTVDGEEQTVSYDISDYKNTAPVTDAIKISIAINDEIATLTDFNGTTNIYSYTSGGKAVTVSEENPLVMERFYGLALPNLCNEFPQKTTTDTMSTLIDCPSAKSAGTADWYFDSETYEPIACAYNVQFSMAQDVTLSSAVINGTLDLDTSIAYTYIFLFSNYYPCMAS